jgi:poly-gamma-glutamate synthesis protein (capsule biosynthesis protein)
MKKPRILILLLIILVVAGAALFYQTQISVRPLTHKAFSEDLLKDKTLEVKGPDEITLVLVGDIMLSRNVGSKIRAADDPDLPFKNVTALLAGDAAFANLEAPFLDSGAPVTAGVSFKVEPFAVAGLKNAGFTVVSCANNHILDRGRTGLDYTLKLLQENGIAASGCGANAMNAHRSAILQVQGKKLGFLSYAYSPFSPLVAGLEIEAMQKDVRALKDQVDIIVVSLHAGTEYTLNPAATQKNFAHAAIDAGADVVVGHHPHWIQTVEQYKSGLIFYSLGNFVFDQNWSQKTSEGLVVKLRLQDGQLKTAELLPVIMENNCCPRPANAEEADAILQSLHASSTIILTRKID